ncbi:transmembrane emp24 domain-containing protein p24delta3-like [Diospyros lotus]|uniref:transmembrane emp24 domain-containing protein p24delta3-like n=1 Tax=Diospyros lotus TaxID=55363 RepID=UPI00224FEAD0|nr:transmembrane emp24 domain-containing protein p24delta3-like [Diospyros lotus]
MAEAVMAGVPALLRRLLAAVMCCCLASHLLLLPLPAQAIWLKLPSSGTKCLSEEIRSNVVVLADYDVINDNSHERSDIPTISARVTSPYGNNLHHQENVTHGQFAFTTKESGSYVACFWVGSKLQGDHNVTVSLEWRIGIAAKEWETVATKSTIESIEFELTKLEGAVEDIHENLIHLKNREAELREVSETANARVAWFSIMSLGVCIIASVLQSWHLKRFFRKKKLI